MTTGERIQKARKKAGKTQVELGKQLGVSGSMIAQYETNKRKPKIDTLQRIAAALNVQVYELIGDLGQLKEFASNLGMNWVDLYPEEEQGRAIVDRISTLTRDIAASGAVIHKLSEIEAYRMGILDLQFKSEEDRIVFFYHYLNVDGKLVASRKFFQNLDPNSLKEVADYVEELSKKPQYQKVSEPEESTTEAPEDK